ncbi:hypothetical protein Tco_0279793 [Tanacetum coccineum]
MVSELRLRYEHEIMMREKHEKKFTDSAAVVQQRDVEVVDLKARLEKSKAEAAEVIELHKCVFDLEAMVVVKVHKVATLNTQNAGFLEKVSTLELGKMWEEFMSQQDAAKRHFSEQAAELDARITNVRRDMDNDLYPYMLTAIAGQR